MSSTRKAKDDSVFHQDKFASSTDFERGLIANLVAKRCARLPDAGERELVWFVQYLSHRAGGLAAIAADLLEKFRDRLGPVAMVAASQSAGEHFNAEQVRQIRSQMPIHLRKRFFLLGEIDRSHVRDIAARKLAAERAQLESQHDDLDHMEMREVSRRIEDGRRAIADESAARSAAQENPSSYPVESFLSCCVESALNGGQCDDKTESLERELMRLCLDPAFNMASGPWYFSDLVPALRVYHEQWQAEKSRVYVTSLGKRVCGELDFTLETRSRTLIEGGARLGKSFSAKAWCDQHPGRARFVEIPPGNDETSFYHALARGLGLGNFLNYKVTEIRQRVESVVLNAGLLLVLDEAHRLWPQYNQRYGSPKRIEWLMSMGNAGVPICMISTPQFLTSQAAMAKNGWNFAQFIGRLGDYVRLPSELEVVDLIGVARHKLPHASDLDLKAIALYARASVRHLAAVDAIAERALYISKRNGREQCTSKDIKQVMEEFVIPSDTKLHRALEEGNKLASRRAIGPAQSRSVNQAVSGRTVFPDRSSINPELVQG